MHRAHYGEVLVHVRQVLDQLGLLRLLLDELADLIQRHIELDGQIAPDSLYQTPIIAENIRRLEWVLDATVAVSLIENVFILDVFGDLLRFHLIW